jgi:hypothetical protein
MVPRANVHAKRAACRIPPRTPSLPTMTTASRQTIRRPGRGLPGLRRALARLAPVVALLVAGTGCGNGDDSYVPAPTVVRVPEGGVDATSPVPPADAAVADAGATEAGIAGVAKAMFSSAPIDLGVVSCGASGSATLTVTNAGTGPLAVSASTTGTAFSVTPATLTLPPGGPDATLTIVTNVPGSSTAAIPLTGSVNLFTDDPAQPSASVPLTVTPGGATVVLAQSGPAAVSFPSTEVNQPAQARSVTFMNTGNAPATVSFSPPMNSSFSLSGSLDSQTVGVGGTLSASFGFTPTTTGPSSASAVLSVTGVTCGASVGAVMLTGQGAVGAITGYPSAPIDFGFADCGGSRPPPQVFTLTNTGTIDAHVTQVSITGAPGFSTSATVGAVIPASGGTLGIACSAPLVVSPSPLTPISAVLSLQTDADKSPQLITLSETPHGAVLAFDDAPGFGSFGQVVLLQAVSQPFSVTNKGNAAAAVTLSVSSTGSGAAPFTVNDPSFAISANGTQTDGVTFSPTGASNTGSLAMTATGPLCAGVPAALPLSGTSIGGGPVVSPTSLAFGASCGGAAPPPQTFSVTNKGNANLNWAMASATGPGSAQYKLSASPAPGLLMPGQSATVTVTASAVPTPAANPSPSAYAAQVTVTTDVPYDSPHVVSLGETPLGDQLSLSVSNLRFGQFPIANSTIAQGFTVTNSANAGSPSANLSLAVGGSGASAYALAPTTIQNLGPSGAVSGIENVMFRPTAATSYPASVAITTSDSLCAPLPSPIQLSGTGTQGKVSVSATTLAFGSDTNDAAGLVNCGATGVAHAFTVSNVGNQQFNVTAMSLGLGASSPYTLSGDVTTFPTTIPIGGTATITVTPKAIPGAVANPGDPSPFTDTLTLTTDAALDSPHRIALVMQARGAVIANTPLTTLWSFGTLGNGLIGAISNAITNTGNAAASVSFQGLQHPSVFGLQSAPTIVAANGVTDVVGQFSPPATNQVWTDQGTLVVTASQAFCEPLPASWSSPTIMLSGSSIAGSLPVTVSGSLAFPSTSCGSAAPAAQSITLTNTTNVAYVFTAQLNSGAFYTLQNPSTGDASAGIIPGNGVVVLGVTPQTVTPGQSAVAGAAPYADDLIVSIQSPTPSGVTIPISWTLNGAMLSLPQGLGPNKDAMGNAFYAADSQSGLTLPMDNAGTATATVQFGVQPTGAFSFSPAPPISVEPNIRALPRLSSSGSDAPCPSLTSGSATFLYSGPVCRPFPFSQVSIQSCVGTF